jgi:hypothetical protein
MEVLLTDVFWQSRAAETRAWRDGVRPCSGVGLWGVVAAFSFCVAILWGVLLLVDIGLGAGWFGWVTPVANSLGGGPMVGVGEGGGDGEWPSRKDRFGRWWGGAGVWDGG